jgi:hypothetical protein
MRGCKNFPGSRSHLVILCSRKLTQSKIYTEDRFLLRHHRKSSSYVELALGICGALYLLFVVTDDYDDKGDDDDNYGDNDGSSGDKLSFRAE